MKTGIAQVKAEFSLLCSTITMAHLTLCAYYKILRCATRSRSELTWKRRTCSEFRVTCCSLIIIHVST